MDFNHSIKKILLTGIRYSGGVAGGGGSWAEYSEIHSTRSFVCRFSNGFLSPGVALSIVWCRSKRIIWVLFSLSTYGCSSLLSLANSLANPMYDDNSSAAPSAL